MKEIPIRSIRPPLASPLDGFKLRSVEEVLSGHAMNQDLHRHDFYFLLAVRKGSGVHEIDFVKYPVKTNTVFLMRPGQVHKLQLRAGSTGYVLEFSKDFHFLSSGAGSELLRRAGHRSCCQLDKSGGDAFYATLQIMLEEFRAKKVGFEHVIRAQLEVLLVQYQRLRKIGPDSPVRGSSYQQEKLQAFLDAVEIHFATTRQAAAYADMVHLSPFQLNSITRKLLGKTVSQLIEDQVMLEAKRHLLATPNQVIQIADQLGFEDVSYFIRLFKKVTGHTPEAFRKNFR